MSHEILISFTYYGGPSGGIPTGITVNYYDLQIRSAQFQEFFTLLDANVNVTRFWNHRFKDKSSVEQGMQVLFTQGTSSETKNITSQVLQMIQDSQVQYLTQTFVITGTFSLRVEVAPISDGLRARMQQEFEWLEEQLQSRQPTRRPQYFYIEPIADKSMTTSQQFYFGEGEQQQDREHMENVIKSASHSEVAFQEVIKRYRNSPTKLSPVDTQAINDLLLKTEVDLKTRANYMSKIHKMQYLHEQDHHAGIRSEKEKARVAQMTAAAKQQQEINKVHKDHEIKKKYEEDRIKHEEDKSNWSQPHDPDVEMIDTSSKNIPIIDPYIDDPQAQINAYINAPEQGQAIESIVDEFVSMYGSELIKTGMSDTQKDEVLQSIDIEKDWNADGQNDDIDIQIYLKIKDRLRAIDTRTWTESAVEGVYNVFDRLMSNFIPSSQALELHNYLSEVSTVKGVLNQKTFVDKGIAVIVNMLQTAVDLVISATRLFATPARMAHNWLKGQPITQGEYYHLGYDILQLTSIIGYLQLFRFISGVYKSKGVATAAVFGALHIGKEMFVQAAADVGAESVVALAAAEDFDPQIKRLVAGGVAFSLMNNVPLIPWQIALAGGAAAAISIPNFVLPYGKDIVKLALTTGIRGVANLADPVPNNVRVFFKVYEHGRIVHDLHQVIQQALGGEQAYFVRHARDALLNHPQLQQQNYRAAGFGGEAYRAILPEAAQHFDEHDVNIAIEQQYDWQRQMHEHADRLFGPQAYHNPTAAFTIHLVSGLLTMFYVTKIKYKHAEYKVTNFVDKVYDKVQKVVGNGTANFQDMSKSLGQQIKDLYGNSTINLTGVSPHLKNAKDKLTNATAPALKKANKIKDQVVNATAPALKKAKEYIVNATDVSNKTWTELGMATLMTAGAVYALKQGVDYAYSKNNDVSKFPEFQATIPFANPIGPQNKIPSHKQPIPDIMLPPQLEKHIKETYESTQQAPSHNLIFRSTPSQRKERQKFEAKQYNKFRKGVMKLINVNKVRQSPSSRLGKRLIRSYLYDY